MDKFDKADRASTSTPSTPTHSSPSTPRAVAGTLGAALGALFMIGAITFGATAIRPLTAGPAAQDQTARADRADRAGHGDRDLTNPDRTGDDAHKEIVFQNGDEAAFRQAPKPQPKPEPKPEPVDEPADEPKEEPAHNPYTPPADEPKEEPKPKPEPVTTSMELGAWVKEGKVKLSWSKFRGDGFAYYKVVRSYDGDAAWPLGAGDQLVAAISDRYTTYVHDGAPCGTQFTYRVFAVQHSASGYAVLAASNVAGAFVECHEPEPAPEPVTLAFQVQQTDGGAGVFLSWEQCTSDGFVYYKVVRSATNSDPRYPLNDGTELLAAIGDPGVTTFLDDNVAPGQTWFYRVLALAEGGDGWVVVGMTNALSITVA